MLPSKTFNQSQEPAKILNAQNVNQSMDAQMQHSANPLQPIKPSVRVQTPTPTSFLDNPSSNKLEHNAQASHVASHTNFLTSQTEARKRTMQSEQNQLVEQKSNPEMTRVINLVKQEFASNLSNDVSTDSGVPPRRRSRSKGKQRNQKSKPQGSQTPLPTTPSLFSAATVNMLA